MELTSTTQLMYMHGHPESSVMSATNVYKNIRLDTKQLPLILPQSKFQSDQSSIFQDTA